MTVCDALALLHVLRCRFCLVKLVFVLGHARVMVVSIQLAPVVFLACVVSVHAGNAANNSGPCWVLRLGLACCHDLWQKLLLVVFACVGLLVGGRYGVPVGF